MSKIRYAVVGAGWISQEAFMPSIAQTGNSEMTAIITGNVEKAKKLAEFYGIRHIYTYDQYDEALKSGNFDAIYNALPNSMHADYTIRALNAGLQDRKSTRLNSSHITISYAVFCLKKKNKIFKYLRGIARNMTTF